GRVIPKLITSKYIGDHAPEGIPARARQVSCERCFFHPDPRISRSEFPGLNFHRISSVLLFRNSALYICPVQHTSFPRDENSLPFRSEKCLFPRELCRTSDYNCAT